MNLSSRQRNMKLKHIAFIHSLHDVVYDIIDMFNEKFNAGEEFPIVVESTKQYLCCLFERPWSQNEMAVICEALQRHVACHNIVCSVCNKSFVFDVATTLNHVSSQTDETTTTTSVVDNFFL